MPRVYWRCEGCDRCDATVLAKLACAALRRAVRLGLVSASDVDPDDEHPGESGAERTTHARLDQQRYLLNIERLANDVADEALREGWLMYLPDDELQSPLQRSINELARNLRHVHHPGDSCLD